MLRVTVPAMAQQQLSLPAELRVTLIRGRQAAEPEQRLQEDVQAPIPVQLQMQMVAPSPKHLPSPNRLRSL
jgi:hypothetical protein